MEPLWLVWAMYCFAAPWMLLGYVASHVYCVLLPPDRVRRWRNRLRARWTDWRARPHLDEANRLFREFEETMDAFDAANKAENPNWDGIYTPEQRAELDGTHARALQALVKAFPKKLRRKTVSELMG